MNFSIQIVLTKEYYESYYREWAARKWLRRAQPYLAAFMILFSGLLRYADRKNVLGFFPYLFMLAGVYEFVAHFYEKHRWLRARLKSGLINQAVFIEFSSDSFKSSGPFANGTVKWAGIKSICQTPNGIFLVPSNGLSIYLPKVAFATDEQFLAVANAKTNPAAG